MRHAENSLYYSCILTALQMRLVEEGCMIRLFRYQKETERKGIFFQIDDFPECRGAQTEPVIVHHRLRGERKCKRCSRTVYHDGAGGRDILSQKPLQRTESGVDPGIIVKGTGQTEQIPVRNAHIGKHQKRSIGSIQPFRLLHFPQSEFHLALEPDIILITEHKVRGGTLKIQFVDRLQNTDMPVRRKQFRRERQFRQSVQPNPRTVIAHKQAEIHQALLFQGIQHFRKVSLSLIKRKENVYFRPGIRPHQ